MDLDLEQIFHAKGGEVYRAKGYDIEISPISKSSLSPEWQQVIDARKKSTFGGKAPSKINELSDLSGFNERFESMSLSATYNSFASQLTLLSPGKNLNYISYASEHSELSELFYGDEGSDLDLVIESAIRTFLRNEIYVENVPGDGNCFFHAISRQLEAINSQKILNHLELRQFAINYVQEHSQDFIDFLDNDIDLYISEMSQDRTWADNPIIQALANDLGVNIQIYNVDGSIINIYPNNIAAENTVRIAYTGNHYLSVRSTSLEQEQDENIERLVESTDISLIEDSEIYDSSFHQPISTPTKMPSSVPTSVPTFENNSSVYTIKIAGYSNSTEIKEELEPDATLLGVITEMLSFLHAS